MLLCHLSKEEKKQQGKITYQDTASWAQEKNLEKIDLTAIGVDSVMQSHLSDSTVLKLVQMAIDHQEQMKQMEIQKEKISNRMLDNQEIGFLLFLSLIKASGEYQEKASPFSFDLSASYYFGPFYFTAGCEAPQKNYNRSSVAWQRERSYYFLTAGWGNAKWKAKVDLSNIFRSDWQDAETTIATPLYSQKSTAFGNYSRRRISFTLSYTFGYGKKVKQGNELGTASGGQSSIL